MSEDISVEVVYALPQKQEVLSLKIRSGAVVSEAIEQSGILRDFPEIDLASAKVGIYSKQVKLDAVLRDKDRIEIYRPLIADPKEIRRKRAAEGKEDEEGGRRRRSGRNLNSTHLHQESAVFFASSMALARSLSSRKTRSPFSLNLLILCPSCRACSWLRACSQFAFLLFASS